MRKKQIYLILAFLLTNLISGQKVTLKPTVVNGVSVSNGPINLASVPYSTILLVADVEIPANVSVGDQGTITIYFSKATGIGSNVSIGGNGGSLYFGGGKKVSRNFTINLNWTDFSTSGGYIYCEYKNNGVSFKSPNISVIKNPTVNTGTILNPPADAPNPNTIVNTLCCDQTIRLGEKPAPVIGSQYLNPYQNEPYGINSTWNIGTNNTDLTNNILTFDYVTELKNFTVTRSLGYRYKLEFPNKSNTVTITIIPSPLNSNEISVDAPKDSNGYAEIITTNPKDIIGSYSTMNVTTLLNPSNVPKRSDKYTDITRFEWEYSLVDESNIWINIPNENSKNINTSSIKNLKTSKDNLLSIRRIAIYENLRIASNSLKIVLRTTRNNNTICCDQKLKIISSQEIEKPSLIIGSTAVSGNNSILYYQWQQRPINNRESIGNWSNISGATSKDFSPPPLQYITNPRGTTIQQYSYRRVAAANYYGGEVSYSNEVNISPNYDRASSTSSSIVIYPNPATSIINIENKENIFTLSNIQLSIVDINGTEVNSNNFTLTNPNLITINISNLITGTYFINLQNLVNGRRNLQQFTFIKS